MRFSYLFGFFSVWLNFSGFSFWLHRKINNMLKMSRNHHLYLYACGVYLLFVEPVYV